MRNLRRGTTQNQLTLYHYDSIVKDIKQQKHVYEYDSCGNMTYEYMRGNGTGEATVENFYTYDELHRVVNAKENYGNATRTYQYDSLGNLTWETNSNNVTVDYILNNLNQITSSTEDGWKTSTTFSYDARSNLIQENYTKNKKVSVLSAYTYDETNKMVNGVNDIGESSEYLYNGLGALVTNTWIIKKNAYGYHDVQIDAVVEGETVVDTTTNTKTKKAKKSTEEVAASEELNKSSTVVKQFVVDYNTETFEPLMEHEVNGLDYKYVYGNDRLSVDITSVTNSMSIVENGDHIRLYYHIDYLGTTDYLTSPVSLKITSWTHYNEWGEITHNAVLKCGQRELDLVKRYATHDYDNVLDLYYAKARFYDADNRRFVAVDPILDPSQYDIREYVDDPMQMVQYLYVSNAPLIFIDFYGLEKVIVSGNHAYKIRLVKKYAIANFIEPAIRSIREWLSDGQTDESITWLITNDGYGDSTGFFHMSLVSVLYQLQEDYPDCFQSNSLDPVNLELTLSDGIHKLSIEAIGNKTEFRDYITDGLDRTQEKITNMIVFAHAVPGELSLGYNEFTKKYNITVSDLEKWGDLSSAFSDDYFCVLYACNTGTAKTGTPFAQAWADATGGYVIGLAGLADSKHPYNAKTTYGKINYGRSYPRFSEKWLEFWFGSRFYLDGSWYYPRMSDDNPGQWNLYIPNSSPIPADSIMDIDERLTCLPTLQDIESLLP